MRAAPRPPRAQADDPVALPDILDAYVRASRLGFVSSLLVRVVPRAQPRRSRRTLPSDRAPTGVESGSALTRPVSGRRLHVHALPPRKTDSSTLATAWVPCLGSEGEE